MLKASALYIVIIIALVIGILCSAVVFAGYFYKMQYQRKFRYDLLDNNLSSAVNMLIADERQAFDEEKISLFGDGNDSVSVEKLQWGLFEVAIAKAFIQKDSLYDVFTLGSLIDSAKWAALYLPDEDRPLSLSGKTLIKGTAYIPQAGLREAYVNNRTYEGDKKLVTGTKHNSEKTLPALNPDALILLKKQFEGESNKGTNSLNADSLSNSFLHAVIKVNFGKNEESLKDIKLNDNIILYSDTTITLEATASLKNILVFAKSIKVKSGFKGNCQLFATDTIIVEDECHFTYPSVIGLLQFQGGKHAPATINIGKQSVLEGIIFTYQESEKELKSQIEIGDGSRISGQLYAQGILSFNGKVQVSGSTYAGRFRYMTNYTQYENYLIDAKLDATALSKYYLTSGLLPAASKRKKVLQWLQRK